MQRSVAAARWRSSAALAAVSALLLTGCRPSGQVRHDLVRATGTTTPSTVTPAQTTTPTDARRPDPTPCADPGTAEKQLTTTTPPGAAEHALTGAAVSTAFSLDDGSFSAAPPPPDFRPALSERQAGCQLLSATGSSGPARLALATVTERGAGVPAYDQRVAWILIGQGENGESCPTYPPGPSGSPAPSTPAAPDVSAPAWHPYVITAVDATTGGDAVQFTEEIPDCSNRLRMPRFDVPAETLSVPWRVVSRAADDRSAQISALWDACTTYALAGSSYGNGVPGTAAWVGRSGKVTVSGFRPFGAQDCGPARPHELTLHPATVHEALPRTLGHGPLGVLVDGSGL